VILRSFTVLDQNGVPVPGASVYVYDIDGNDAVMTSDGTAALVNPITTDEFGGGSYYANTGYYTEDIWFGGRRRWREHNIAIGSPGADLNLRTDMAATSGAALVGAVDGASGANFTTVAGFIAKLLSSAGSSILGFIQSGTGAASRLAQDKLRETVSSADFGAKGDGTTDDTAAIQNALNSLGTAGGTVLIPAGKTPYIASNLNVPDNCKLVGAKSVRGRTFGAPNLNLLMPRLILARTATITLNDSSELENLCIIPQNFTFSDTRANVDLWTGTAVTLGDNKADMVVRSCLILGFNQAISTGANTRVDRPKITDVRIDCNNGIYLKNCYDVPYIDHVHGWPFTTLQSAAETNSAQLKRGGNFIQLDGTLNDWTKISDCFCYGYAVGFRATGADSFTFVSCSADNPPGTADGSIGFLVESTSLEGRLLGCQAAGVQTGIKIDTTDTNGRVFINGTNVWETFTQAVQVIHGDVVITGSGLRNTGGVGIGVRVETTATQVRLVGTKLNNFLTGISTDANTVKVLREGCDFDGTTTPANNPYLPSVASAATLAIDGKNRKYQVTGTTGITAIANPSMYADRLLTLVFAGALTVTNGASLKLAGAVNFSATADDALTLTSDGSVWREVSRSVN
jgi:hypothetical protein